MESIVLYPVFSTRESVILDPIHIDGAVSARPHPQPLAKTPQFATSWSSICSSWGAITKITKISVSTFGIYLVHYFIIRTLTWNGSPIPASHPFALQVFVITIAAFVLSLGVTFLIGKLPGAKYLVGHKM